MKTFLFINHSFKKTCIKLSQHVKCAPYQYTDFALNVVVYSGFFLDRNIYREGENYQFPSQSLVNVSVGTHKGMYVKIHAQTSKAELTR